jgi:hypothetical protein
MGTIARRGIIGLAALAMTVTAVQAQELNRRRGFYASLGPTYGWASISCNECPSSQSRPSWGGFLKGGWNLSPNWQAGVEGNVWTKTEGGTRDRLEQLSAAAYFYPAADAGFFLKGGAGLSGEEYQPTGSARVSSGWSIGLLTGVGYDVRIAGDAYLTPVVNFYYGAPRTIENGSAGTIFTGSSFTVVDIGIGITWH